jgi:hypothetical protein
MLGCGEYRVARAIGAGQSEQRSAPRAWPSLRRSSVEAFAPRVGRGEGADRSRGRGSPDRRRVARVPDPGRRARVAQRTGGGARPQLVTDARRPAGEERQAAVLRRTGEAVVPARPRRTRGSRTRVPTAAGGRLSPTHEQARRSPAMRRNERGSRRPARTRCSRSPFARPRAGHAIAWCFARRSFWLVLDLRQAQKPRQERRVAAQRVLRPPTDRSEEPQIWLDRDCVACAGF